MSLKNKGFSLVEIIIIAGSLAGIALVVTRLAKSMTQTQEEVASSSDFVQLEKEINNLINDGQSCKASLAGVKFSGSTIKDTPSSGIEIWSVDQSGNRNTKKYFAEKVVGKLTINSITMTMPDYTAKNNFAPGKDQVFKAEIKVSGSKTSLGKAKTLKEIKQTVSVKFDTDETGKSVIKSCYAGPGFIAPTVAVGANCVATTENIAVDANGTILTCQYGAWKASAGGYSICTNVVSATHNKTACGWTSSVSCPPSTTAITAWGTNASNGALQSMSPVMINGLPVGWDLTYTDIGTCGSSPGFYAATLCCH